MVLVIARSAATKRSTFVLVLDCFALLAMTGRGHFFFPGPGKPPRPGSVGLPLSPVSPGKFGRPERRPAGRSFGRAGIPPGAPPPGIFSASALIFSGGGMPPPQPLAFAVPAHRPRLPEPLALILFR